MQKGNNKECLKVLLREQAVVVGASMAGMLTARVLAERFENVALVESDRLPDDPSPRAGIPQARHLHALLPRGLRILEDLFPGIKEELRTAGAVKLDVADDVAWLTPQGWGVRCPSNLEALAFTRDLLDWAVRHRLTQLPNVELSDRCCVQSLVGDARRVEGVRLRCEHTTGEIYDSTLKADLLVVATGRHAAVPKWLEELGVPLPEIREVNAHVGYASRILRRPEAFRAPWKAIFIQAAPPEARRGGILFPVEGNRWLVTLQGGDGDYPPADEAGFLDFAGSLRSRALYDAIKDAEPLTPITSYRSTENRLRHFERLRLWPERLLVLGDAACAFNPVYGQGMTTAALAVESLRCHLKQHGPSFDGFAPAFQKEVARINTAPWMLATSEDLRFRSVEGVKASLSTKLMHSYVDRVLGLGTQSPRIRKQFLEVQGMVKGPGALFRPPVLARVLLQSILGNFNRSQTGISSLEPEEAS
jgi:2-polyprenyl-6-methoxyphenol hydroxylase-like FAD-dependent oxidoreductase